VEDEIYLQAENPSANKRIIEVYRQIKILIGENQSQALEWWSIFLARLSEAYLPGLNLFIYILYLRVLKILAQKK
jgi:hypothetical protein